MTTSTGLQNSCLASVFSDRAHLLIAILLFTCIASGTVVRTSLAQSSLWQSPTGQSSAGQSLSSELSLAQSEPDTYRSPRGALIRSVILPGWGQLYNRHYYKIPIVYAGLGSLVYIVTETNSEYKLYRHAFQYKAWEETIEEGEVNPVAEFESDYLRLLAREGLNEISSSTLEPARDRLRRNRDFAILGIAVVYGLATLDAYVSAHLLDFDIGDDLSLRVLPRGKGLSFNLQLH